MAVNFPSNPNDGDIHTELGRGWQYNATAGGWKSIIRIDSVVDTDDINELAGATNKFQRNFSIQTADFNAVSGERYGVDTSSNIVTATLPGSPVTGDAIYFADAGGNFAVNKLTLGRNGNTIMGLAADFDVTTNNQSLGVFYNGTTWRTY